MFNQGHHPKTATNGRIWRSRSYHLSTASFENRRSQEHRWLRNPSMASAEDTNKWRRHLKMTTKFLRINRLCHREKENITQSVWFSPMGSSTGRKEKKLNLCIIWKQKTLQYHQISSHPSYLSCEDRRRQYQLSVTFEDRRERHWEPTANGKKREKENLERKIVVRVD